MAIWIWLLCVVLVCTKCFQGVQRSLQNAVLLLSELDEQAIGDYSMNHLEPKISRLSMLFEGHLSLFKVNTGLYPNQFETLSQIVCPYIAQSARSTYQQRLAAGSPSKLNAQERLLSCAMYFRSRNGARDEAASWYYSRTSLLGDVMLVCSVVNEVMESEIRWPDANRREITRNHIPPFPASVKPFFYEV